MVSQLHRAALLVSASLLGCAPAFAQAATDQQTVENAEAGAQQGEIVVTALKRATTIQNTPIAISALSDKALTNMGATTISDIVRMVPGFNLTESDSGRTRISIRGIQTAGESTVGLYYGETPLTGPAGTTSDPAGATPNLNLFDVQRVEVLRGPQGTLYGSGSMGGTLRVLFEQPNLDKIEAATEFQLSDTKGGAFGYFAKGAASVPIVADKLGIRLVGYREQIGGYVDNTRLNSKNGNRGLLEGGRALVEIRPTERLQFNAMAMLQTQDIAGSSQWLASAGPYISRQSISQPWHDKLQLYNLTSKWDIGFATVTVANSYYKWKVQSTNDNSDNYASVAASNRYCPLYQTNALRVPTTTCTAAQTAQYQAYAASIQPVGAFQPRFVKNWTNEVRLSSNSKGRLNWTLGAFHEDRNDRVDTLVFPGVAATGEMRQPVVDLGSRYVTDVVKQTAFFGEASWNVLKPLTLTVGIRHYDYTKVVGGESTNFNYFNGQTPRAYQEVNANAKGWVKKFNADVKINRNLMVYAQASQGFRPGGANNIPGLPLANAVYQPDSLWNYEGGVKSQFFDRRVSLNVAVYRIEWRNLQTSVQASFGNFSFIDNIGKARVEGVEVEATASPIDGLNFNGSFNAINARLTADQISAQSTAPGRDGDKLTYIPRMTASAGGEYNWPLFGAFMGLIRADWTYTGKMNTELRPTNVNYRLVGKYSSVNARIGVQKADFGVYLFVSNLFDKVGISRIAAVAGTPDYDVSIRPRTIGITMRKSF